MKQSFRGNTNMPSETFTTKRLPRPCGARTDSLTKSAAGYENRMLASEDIRS